MNNEKIITLARETATLFRLGHEAEASVLMRKLIDALQLRLQEQTLPNQVLTIFPQMLSSQERRDWLGLADTLEYELVLQFQQRQS